MLKMRVEDKNPCKFNFGPSSSNMAGTIQKYLKELVFPHFSNGVQKITLEMLGLQTAIRSLMNMQKRV